MDKLRAGIIGFGGMGQRHYRAYQGTACEVVAICEFAPERVMEHLPNFPRNQIYQHYTDLLANEKLDMLSVVSNGPTHSEITAAAVQAGIGRVFCEKPVATSVKEAERLAETIRRNGARVAVNHLRRWSDAYRRIKTLIREGVIGELCHIYFQCGSTGLGNFVIHAFDLMRFLSDSEAAWAIGMLDKTGTPNPRGPQFRDPAGYGMVVFQNGLRCFVDSSEDTGIPYLYVLAGTYGRIVIDELAGSWRIWARSGKLRGEKLTRYGTPLESVPFNGGAYDIVELTRNGLMELAGDGPLSCTVEDGIKSLEIVMAFHESEARGNARVEFPLNGAARERMVEIA